MKMKDRHSRFYHVAGLMVEAWSEPTYGPHVTLWIPDSDGKHVRHEFSQNQHKELADLLEDFSAHPDSEW